MQIALVPRNNIDEILSEVGPILIRATDLSGGRWSLPDVLDQIDTGQQQLWIAFDDERIWAACTTRFSHYAKMKMLEGCFVAGDKLDTWCAPLLEVLDRWAADNDCAGIEFTGRMGWEKVLKPYGFRRAYIVLEKRYEGGQGQ